MIKQIVDFASTKYLDAETFKNTLEKIMSIQNLQELYQVGKELTEFQVNDYKKAALIIYKSKKAEIVKNMLKENTVFSNLFYLIMVSDMKQLKNIGKLLYNLKNLNVMTKEEINELFEIFEKKKAKLSKEISNDNEIIDEDPSENDEIVNDEI